MPTIGSKLDQGKELSIKFGDFRAILKQLPQTNLPADISYLTKTIGHLMDKVTVIATISSDDKPIWDVARVGEKRSLNLWKRANHYTY